MPEILQTAFKGANFGDLDISVYVERIGKHYRAIGEHADLWEGRLTDQSGQISVAIKVLRGGYTSDPRFVDKLTKSLVKEANKWLQFKHENVIRFYGIALNCGYMPALVLPFYSNGSIVNYAKKEILSEARKLDLVKEIANGIAYLHSFNPPVVHGDLRGANVLIDDDGHAVIADYGLVFVIETTDFTSTKTAGTCRWMAPEVMNPSEEDLDSQEPAVLFTTYSDIYAFAMTVFEVMSGDVPFSNKKTDSAVIFYVLGGKRPESAQHLKSTTLRELVERCWNSDPSVRPTTASVVEELGKIQIQITVTPVQDTGWFSRLFNYFWPVQQST